MKNKNKNVVTPKIVALMIAQEYFTIDSHDKITEDYSQEVAHELWAIANRLSKQLSQERHDEISKFKEIKE